MSYEITSDQIPVPAVDPGGRPSIEHTPKLDMLLDRAANDIAFGVTEAARRIYNEYFEDNPKATPEQYRRRIKYLSEKIRVRRRRLMAIPKAHAD